MSENIGELWLDCRTCGGSGGGDGYWRCPDCRGRGQVRNEAAVLSHYDPVREKWIVDACLAKEGPGMRDANHWADDFCDEMDAESLCDLVLLFKRCQADAFAAGRGAGLEKAARICDLGSRLWRAEHLYPGHETAGLALITCADDIRALIGLTTAKPEEGKGEA